MEASGSVRYPAEYIQQVYDQAFANGILDEPLVYDPASGVLTARIEGGFLIETIDGELGERKR